MALTVMSVISGDDHIPPVVEHGVNHGPDQEGVAGDGHLVFDEGFQGASPYQYRNGRLKGDSCQ